MRCLSRRYLVTEAPLAMTVPFTTSAFVTTGSPPTIASSAGRANTTGIAVVNQAGPEHADYLEHTVNKRRKAAAPYATADLPGSTRAAHEYGCSGATPTGTAPRPHADDDLVRRGWLRARLIPPGQASPHASNVEPLSRHGLISPDPPEIRAALRHKDTKDNGGPIMRTARTAATTPAAAVHQHRGRWTP